MNKKILILLPVEEHHKRQLETAAGNATFLYSSISEVTEELVQEANVIVGNVPAHLIKASKNLELLQLNSAGTDEYIIEGILHPKTILTNASGAYGKAVSEHTFAMALALTKKLHLYRDDQFQGSWNDYGQITSLSDATVLIMGLGDIGLSFARLCKAMGAHTIGIKRRHSACPEGVDELYLTEELYKIVPHADIIAAFLPQTPDTVHMFDDKFFASMKKTAVFLNAGRGSSVDQEALLRALESGQIGGAGLDVTDPEPLPADHPLWKQRNCLITPHISGGFHLQETFEQIIRIAAANLEHYQKGEPFINVIDFATGYRK
ncbi:MAG: D-2-hydroxyacid dehydrogenase [Lachnospiraceae bacterium]|jgi:phosphoglycerate dehydrogenase-like enzyme